MFFARSWWLPLPCYIVYINNFSERTEAKPIKDKDPLTMDHFLYKVISHHGYFKIKMENQRRNFINSVLQELHALTGVEQWITSAHHSQWNGLVERQNRSMKNALVKILDEIPCQWYEIIRRVLFAYHITRHFSANYSPFFYCIILYNQDLVLPIDVKHNLSN